MAGVTDQDHTAIPIRLDPTRQWMTGTAVHGNTPFSVPYVTPITPERWTSGCSSGMVLPSEVQHVVSLYPWEAYKTRHKVRSTLAVRLYDEDSEPDRNLIHGLANWVNACRKDGITLVHCQAGLNRSALVAGLALCLSEEIPGAEAIALLRKERSNAVLCNPSFRSWLEREMP